MSAPVAPSAGRPRRQRSATESLLSIALGLEAALVFFMTMAALGLQLLPALATLGGGAALLLILIAATRVLRYRWGVWLGWVLQIVIIATGAVVPLMYVVGAGFVVIWIYCFITGTRLDRRNATIHPEE
ncbi:hypothetical protein GCM10027052_10710 [Parafrigoribacterium mesophilum]|uniref:DUF4233 domain-containing protein n=1 Tax=Parafrigoribacterium mesophilum TaxID=433646 RepID=UPI0031FDA487